MMILLFGVLNDEQRALVERIFHEHRVHFQRISFKIVKTTSKKFLNYPVPK